MSNNGDEPAYPTVGGCEECDGRGATREGVCRWCNGLGHLHRGGMTKREVFAAMAMQGMYSATKRNTDGGMNWPNEAACARGSRQQADALLAELAKEEPAEKEQ